MKDLPPDVHSQLDADAGMYSGADVDSRAGNILCYLIVDCTNVYANVWPIDPAARSVKACTDILASREDIRVALRAAHTAGKYAEIRQRPEFHVPEQSYFDTDQHNALLDSTTPDSLREAYNTPFRGQCAHEFLNYLVRTDQEASYGHMVLCAKVLWIVQSSGSGKSRMLTEIGKLTFTLPICVRDPESPGFPPSDKDVHSYFSSLHSDNDLSISACDATARFLGASCETMLKWLRRAQTGRSAEELHEYWYTLMEPSEGRSERDAFFAEVVALANAKNKIQVPSSPHRTQDGLPDRRNFKINTYAKQFYNTHAKKPTEELVQFVSALTPGKPLVAMYFDEAHELRSTFWLLLRLLTNQDKLTRMWYIFMSTKSIVSFFNPTTGDTHFQRDPRELARLLVPYIAVGFDQNAICDDRALVTVTMGYLQSIENSSRFGRPLWNAQHRKGEDDQLIDVAALKLTNGSSFKPKDKNHVLAVISHRLGIEPVISGTEALELVETSVANHMRLLTGFSDKPQTLHTHTPSEPLLTLGAIHLLYNQMGGSRLGQVLNTFSKNLCSAGLVEKGLLGELGGRTLLLTARDFAAPMRVAALGRDLLKPVLLIDFMDILFGNKNWCDPHRAEFMNAFDETYVNFTHWIVTKDPLPAVASQQLLANLWARHGGLQCSFNQESLDLLFVTYKGSVAVDAIFDVTNLSAGIVQIKYKTDAEAQAEPSLWPIGIPRNIHRPLPYFAIVMELGNESCYRETHTRIKATPSPPSADGAFGKLRDEWANTVKHLDTCRTEPRKKGQDAKEKALLKEVKLAQMAMDAYNRFTVSVRGASPDIYGVLRTANIVDEFATLLGVTMPSPTAPAMQYMRPLERLGETSAHTAWMSVYGSGEPEDESMEVDT